MTKPDVFTIDYSTFGSEPWVFDRRVESPKLVPVLEEASQLQSSLGPFYSVRVTRNGNYQEATILRRRY